MFCSGLKLVSLDYGTICLVGLLLVSQYLQDPQLDLQSLSRRVLAIDPIKLNGERRFLIDFTLVVLYSLLRSNSLLRRVGIWSKGMRLAATSWSKVIRLLAIQSRSGVASGG